jgi:hypothetical protein
MKYIIMFVVIFMVGDTVRISTHIDTFILLGVSNVNTDSCYVMLGNINKKLIRYERCSKLRKVFE